MIRIVLTGIGMVLLSAAAVVVGTTVALKLDRDCVVSGTRWGTVSCDEWRRSVTEQRP